MNIFETNFKDDFNYMISTIGESIKINGKDQTALITKGTNKDKIIDYRNIRTDFPIATGDLISYQNQNWVIVGEVYQTKNSCKATLRKAPHVLKIYIHNKLEEIPCIIETFSQSVFENEKIKVLDGNIKLTMQMNNITKKIGSGCRFIKMQSCWEVETKTSEIPGLLYLYARNTELGAYDDKENEIADRWIHEVKHNYNMIINEDNITLEEGQTKQLVINVKDTVDNKTENVVNPNIIYTLLDNSIATIDSKGLITGINEGNTTINVQFENVQKIINVKVLEVDRIQLGILGKDSMPLGRIRTWNSTMPCTWSVEDVDNDGKVVTPWVQITASTDTTCTVKATDKWLFNDSSAKYFNIIAISKDNPNVKAISKIKITPY